MDEFSESADLDSQIGCEPGARLESSQEPIPILIALQQARSV